MSTHESEQLSLHPQHSVLLQGGGNLPPPISSEAGGNGLQPQTSLASTPQHMGGRYATSSLCPSFGVCMLCH